MTKYNLSNGNILKVINDENTDNPREWSNMTVMVCFHNHHTLGDKHDYDHKDYSGWEEMKKAIIKDNDVAIIEPLYLYDHSGITIATSPFSCRWDSGQIGFVYITKKKVREEYSVKRITKKFLESAASVLKGEVETYDQYIRGDVYGFKEETPEGKYVNSCWGFYGYDLLTNGMKEHIQAEILEEI
jgi:hypothetical protein